MSIDSPSYNYDTGPQNIKEVDNYLDRLGGKIGLEEKENDPGGYKELAKKIREYGLEKIKKDISTTKQFTKQSEQLPENTISVRDVPYSTLSTQIDGNPCKINFVDDERKGCLMGWYDPNSKEIFINVSVCEKRLKANMALARQYNWGGDLDLYDFMSGVKAHEDYHKDNELPQLAEEANAEVKILDMVGEPYLVSRLFVPYDEIVSEDFNPWVGVPYEFGNYNTYTDLYKRYTQALKNVLKSSGKESEFKKIIDNMSDRFKTGFVEVDGKFIEKDGLKKKKFIEKDGRQIRQGYYGDEDGNYKQKEYIQDLHKEISTVIDSDILKKIIQEYKLLSKVD